MIRKYFFALFQKSLIFYYKLNHNFHILGPIAGNNLDQDRYSQILSLRNNRFKLLSPYLTKSSEERIDLSKHCDHFLFYKNNKLQGAVRFTDFPLEFGSELDQEITLTFSKKKYKEISRLVTKGSEKISKPLLTFSALHYIKEKEKDGFMAISKLKRTNLFKKFGMKVLNQNITLKSRENGQYNLIHASFDELTSEHLKSVIKNKFKNTFNTFKPKAKLKNEI